MLDQVQLANREMFVDIHMYVHHAMIADCHSTAMYHRREQ